MAYGLFDATTYGCSHRTLDVSTMHQINMFCCLKETRTPFTLHKVPNTQQIIETNCLVVNTLLLFSLLRCQHGQIDKKKLFKIQFKDETIFDLNIRKHIKNQVIKIYV
jgi:hypothetical protein